MSLGEQKEDPAAIQQAIDHIDQALAHGRTLASFKTNPILKTVMQHPRFQRLVEPPTGAAPSEKWLLVPDPIDDTGP